MVTPASATRYGEGVRRTAGAEGKKQKKKWGNRDLRNGMGNLRPLPGTRGVAGVVSPEFLNLFLLRCNCSSPHPHPRQGARAPSHQLMSLLNFVIYASLKNRLQFHMVKIFAVPCLKVRKPPAWEVKPGFALCPEPNSRRKVPFPSLCVFSETPRGSDSQEKNRLLN